MTTQLTEKDVERAVDDAQKILFGGTLASQGRGYYVTLELLAICRGVTLLLSRNDESDTRPLRPPDSFDEVLVFDKPSHDLARRLLHECLAGNSHRIPEDRRRKLTADTGTEKTLEWVANLLAALTVPRPFTRSIPDWGGFHLYPYVGELIHHDAVFRAASPLEQVSLERYSYRGGGALAYQLLRADGNLERLEDLRSDFARVVADGGTALGKLASVLATYDVVGSNSAEPGAGAFGFRDDTVIPHDERRESAWTTLLREGCHRILSSHAPQAKQVEHLMHWVPYALARHQLDLAGRAIGKLANDLDETASVPLDATGHSQLRVAARNAFSAHRRWIADAVAAEALSLLTGEMSESLKRHLAKQGEDTTKFYASTMAVVGAVNANSGLRHYTMNSSLLEAIVFAMVPAETAIPFEMFCEEVFARRLGLVVDSRGAEARGVAAWVDQSQWEFNAAQLGERLLGLGLMTNLSDATRMVEAIP